jgi:hypothetical protein
MLVALLVVGLATSVDSAKPPPLRAVVRVTEPADEVLLARIRGQVNDLAVQLVVERGARLEADVPAQVEAATQLASTRKARVVVWFRHPETGGVVVHVADPDENSLLARWIDLGRGGRLESSAHAEAVALMVRLALRALAAGGHIGVTKTPEPEPGPEPGPEPVASPPAIAEHAEPPQRSWSPVAAAGWSAAVTGAREPVQQGLAVSLGVDVGHWHAALDGVLGLPLTLADGRTSVDLARHEIGARLDWIPLRRDNLQASLGASAGLVAFARSAAVALSTDIDPAPAQTTIAFHVAPGVAAAWRPLEHAPLWLELSAAADVVAGAPRLGYRTAGQFVPTDTLWPVEPLAALSVVLREK